MYREPMREISFIHDIMILIYSYRLYMLHSIIVGNLLILQLYSVYSDEYYKASETYHHRLKTSKLFAELMTIIEVALSIEPKTDHEL